MPFFANDTIQIASTPELIDEQGTVRMIDMMEAFLLADVRVAARHDCATAGLAYGDGDMTEIEAHAVGGESIDIRRDLRGITPVRADGVPVQVVGCYQ